MTYEELEERHRRLTHEYQLLREACDRTDAELSQVKKENEQLRMELVEIARRELSADMFAKLR